MGVIFRARWPQKKIRKDEYLHAYLGPPTVSNLRKYCANTGQIFAPGSTIIYPIMDSVNFQLKLHEVQIILKTEVGPKGQIIKNTLDIRQHFADMATDLQKAAFDSSRAQVTATITRAKIVENQELFKANPQLTDEMEEEAVEEQINFASKFCIHQTFTDCVSYQYLYVKMPDVTASYKNHLNFIKFFFCKISTKLRNIHV